MGFYLVIFLCEGKRRMGRGEGARKKNHIEMNKFKTTREFEHADDESFKRRENRNENYILPILQ